MPALALALLAAPALAADPVTDDSMAADQPLTAADPGAIADYLRRLGYRPETSTDQAGDPWLRLGFAGMQGSIWFNDCDDDGRACESVRLQVGLLTGRKLTLSQVNEFNNRFRFATLSLDEDGDPLLNHDLRLQSPGMAAALFGWTVQQFESVAAELRQLVNEVEKPPVQRD